MVADLAKTDGKVAMAYAKQYGVPWHREGKAVDGLMTTSEALVNGGVNFTVSKHQTSAEVKHPTLDCPVKVKAPYSYIVRDDTLDVLGMVGNKYEIIQTKDAVGFFDAAIGAGAACIDTVGALGKGGRVWLAARMPDSVVVKGDDVIDRYLMLVVGHDGHLGVNAMHTGIRPVCSNTVSAAMKGGKSVIKIRHTANAHKNLDRALKLVAADNIYWKTIRPAFQMMATTDISTEKVNTFFDRMFPATKKDDEGNPALAKQTVDRRAFVTWALDNSPGADMAGKTVWGLYNAYTFWLDHSADAVKSKLYPGIPEVGFRQTKGAGWENSIFATGAKLRDKAFNSLAAML